MCKIFINILINVNIEFLFRPHDSALVRVMGASFGSHRSPSHAHCMLMFKYFPPWHSPIKNSKRAEIRAN